ncbi:YiiG family protein [Phreatobacter aquaticus]|nr:YiiG family protein [Phreatobacter aquaticus]
MALSISRRAGLALAGSVLLMGLGPALAQKDQRVAAPREEADDLQASIAKSNAYTSLMNRTLRAVQSWGRYRSWVDMRRGPTGNERYISYGLYSLYDVTSEIAKAEQATDAQPRLPELDDTMRRYIAAYQRLAPLITRAERYYERKDYRDDAMAEGRALHREMVPAAEAFLEQRAALESHMRTFKGDLDQRELAAIEAREGKSARWQIRNIMINARAVMDLMPSNDRPVVDMASFDRAVAQFSAAVREMDRFKETNPQGVSIMDSQASSWLGKIRDFRDKLARSRGDVRRGGAGNDANWIVSSYNTMVTLSDTAMRTSR